LVVAEDITVTIVPTNTKIRRIDAVPLILDGLDEERAIVDPELEGTFVRLIP
jgi:hypothetical protein